jgi:NTP pyrophosphatase (non-canonical NTP hydrolase)
MTDHAFEQLTAEVLAFRDARNWKQFHTLNHLVAGLNIEASEVQELLLWKTDKEAEEFVKSPEGKQRVGEELADTLIYLLYLAHASGIDLPAALRSKLINNNEKYPVEKSYNSARKYTEYES